MRRDAWRRGLEVWSSGYVGCAIILLVGSRPPASSAFFAQLAWLALIGSVPTALVLAAAVRARYSSPRVVIAAGLAVAVLSFGIGWQHADFLLSGPHWIHHPHRPEARIGLAAGCGMLGAAGWAWLVAGSRFRRRSHAVAWIASTLIGIALSMIAITRYRAYDDTTAQLVFLGGVLAGALIGVVGRASRSLARIAIVFAALSSLAAVGSRWSPAWIATGEREVVAHSRTGALVSLYVLPHVGASRTWSISGVECATPELVVDAAPLPMNPNERRNVILVSVDALRDDLVGQARDRPTSTPKLSKAIDRGVSFQNATTTYPATLFAIGSAFTGLSPAELYLSPAMPETIFTRARGHLDERIIVLPDVSWFRLPIVRELLAPGVETDYAATDAAATKMLIERLDGARAAGHSVLAWIHYYAPHDPYRTHPSFAFGRGKLNAYRSEVAYFDEQIGALFDYLQDAGWFGDSLIVFFSDHGEALGEEGYYGHHVYLDGWMIDVPLVLWHASLEPSRPTVGVSVVDIAPTVMHFLGLPRPADLPGRSLLSLEPNRAGRATFSEAFPVRGRALFETFRLPSLDDATIEGRVRTIRTASPSYEPKGAITKGAARLIHHRSADVMRLHRLAPDGRQIAVPAGEAAAELESLTSDLEQWESEQRHRIGCRLRLNASN